MTARPIETSYAGYRFRSRLEARWAVFFDALGIRWLYEPQGYTLTTSFGERFNYLPDFYLPDLGTWVEVKGSDDDLDRAHITCAAINLPGSPENGQSSPSLLLLGPIPAESGYEWAWLSLSPFINEEGRTEDFAYDWWCAFDGSSKPARLRRCTETSRATSYQAWPEESWLTPVHDATLATCTAAYTAARTARFEHGESGLR